MDQWNPKPMRKPDPNGLFQIDDSVKIVKSVQTPMQRQRELDGTPLTISGPTALRPEGPKLYLDDLSKGSPAPCSKELDADEVVKAYLAKND